jgi:hypothetical protein
MAAQATITRSDPCRGNNVRRRGWCGGIVGAPADIARLRRRSIPEKGVVAAVRCGRKVF